MVVGSRRRNLTAYLFLAPWLIGLFWFTLGPMVASLYLSFTKFDLLTRPRWLGAANYVTIFFSDPTFYKSLLVTFQYVLISVPLKLAFALAVAMVLNRQWRGSAVYRSIFYLPSLIGGSVAVAVMWRQIFGDNGLLNQLLGLVGLQGRIWVADPTFAMYTIILLAVWQFGSPMIIFLAGLRQIPRELYDAADIDGASAWTRFWRMTMPMLSPIIFFNLVMQTFGAFLMFTQAFLVTRGGPINSTLVYSLYLYQQGFNYYQMGYASALSWIILVIIGLVTAFFFRTSSFWVFYQSGGGRR